MVGALMRFQMGQHFGGGELGAIAYLGKGRGKYPPGMRIFQGYIIYDPQGEKRIVEFLHGLLFFSARKRRLWP